MQFKRPFLAYDSTRDPHRQKLESLYAHRTALDAVIQHLEEYNRYRVQRLEPQKRKTA
jgi:hypothetical protein